MCALALVLMLSCVTGAMAQDGNNEIRCWSVGLDLVQYNEEFVAAYNEQGGAYTLVYEDGLAGLQGMTETIQKLRLSLETGTAPDFGNCNAGEHLKAVVESGKVLDLTPYYDEYGWREKLPQKFVDDCTIDGKIYAVPLTIDGVGIYYNKTLFGELGLEEPDTWEDFEHILNTLKDAGHYPYALGLAGGWPSAYQASQYGYISGGSEYLACMKGEFDWTQSEATRLALTKYAMIGREYSNPDVCAINQDQANELFYAGMCAMVLNGSSLINAIQSAEVEFDTGFFVVPPINPDTDITAFGGESDTIFVNADGNVEGVIDFINWWLSDEGCETVLQVGRAIPMVLDAEFSPEGLDPLFYDIACEMQANVDNFGSWPATYMPSYLFSDYNQFIQGMMAGDLTVDEVLEKLQADRVKYDGETK